MKTIGMLIATVYFGFLAGILLYGIAFATEGKLDLFLMRAWALMVLIPLISLPACMWFKSLYNQARVDWIEWKDIK